MANNQPNWIQRNILGQRVAEVAQPNRQVRSALGGFNVTYDTSNHGSNASLALETVYACTSRISQAVAALEVNAYKINGNTRDSVAHPLKDLLTRRPHDRYSAFNFWENIVSDSLLFGRGFAVILRDGDSNKVQGLEYIPASSVSHKTYSGEDVYVVSYTDRKNQPAQVAYRDEEMFVISGYRSLNVFQLHRETLDLAKVSREFGIDYFRNGGRLGGVIEVPHELTDEQYESMRNTWGSQFQGMGNHHGTPILEAGTQYKQFSIPPEEAQFLQTRQYTDQAIARIFQVPAALIGLDTNVTFSNVEQQNIFFSTYTIQPLVKRIENEIVNKLVLPAQRNRLSIEFDMSSLLRADASTRSAYFQTLINSGAMTINEVRKIEGLNPIDGGDTPLVQLNQIPLTAMQDYANSITSSNKAASATDEEDTPTEAD